MFPNKIKIRWYKIMESTFSKINMEGPHTKFCENHSCDVHTNVIKMGASEVEGLGIKNISLARNLTKSATIWNAPFRPISTGPTRRIA